MNYAADYCNVLRYGLAPAESIANFAKQSVENGTFHPQNNSDHVFADHLEEHDDPRSEIVRRDLIHRQSENGIYHDLTRDKINKFGVTNDTDTPLEIHQPDGLLRINSTAHPETNKILGHEVSWEPTHTMVDSKGKWLPQAGYVGNFHPEEFDSMMQKLNLPHSTSSIEQQHKRNLLAG